MTQHGGFMSPDGTIDFKPDESVLRYEFGDEIRLTQGDFVRLAEAFFADVERKFV